MHTFDYYVHPYSTASITTEHYVGIFPCQCTVNTFSLINLLDMHTQNLYFISKSFDLESTHSTNIKKVYILVDVLKTTAKVSK